MDVYFVTTNGGKFRTASREFDRVGTRLIHVPRELEEPRIEDMKNVERIARFKLRQAYALLKKPVIVADSGFYIKALRGWPGPYINFNLNTIGIKGILKLMEDETNREAYFYTAVAYTDGNRTAVYTGRKDMLVADRPRGKKQKWHWSDLSQIVIPDAQGCTKTIAEMSEEEWTQTWLPRLHRKHPSAFRQVAEHIT